jgi:Mg2+-importing ATPase
MLFFGPLSSLFDLGTFALMLWGCHASQSLFQTAWFVESLATQSLVIFVIRTRRTPFFRSRPSLGLVVSVTSMVLVGAVLPTTPLAAELGFVPLPGAVVAAVVALVVAYLALVEVAKGRFFRRVPTGDDTPSEPGGRGVSARLHRRAARFSSRAPVTSTTRSGSRAGPAGR